MDIGKITRFRDFLNWKISQHASLKILPTDVILNCIFPKLDLQSRISLSHALSDTPIWCDHQFREEYTIMRFHSAVYQNVYSLSEQVLNILFLHPGIYTEAIVVLDWSLFAKKKPKIISTFKYSPYKSPHIDISFNKLNIEMEALKTVANQCFERHMSVYLNTNATYIQQGIHNFVKVNRYRSLLLYKQPVAIRRLFI